MIYYELYIMYNIILKFKSLFYTFLKIKLFIKIKQNKTLN